VISICFVLKFSNIIYTIAFEVIVSNLTWISTTKF